MKQIGTVFLVLAIVTGLISILTLIPNESLGIELRTKEDISLYDGPIQFLIISLTSFLFLSHFIINKNKNLAIAFSIVGIIFLGLSYLFSRLEFGPQVKEDRIVYKNQIDQSEKLIFQYYDIGIGKNPRWKTLKTKNINGRIRNITAVNTESLRETVSVGDRTIDLETLPRKLTLDNDIFELERVVLFYSDSTVYY